MKIAGGTAVLRAAKLSLAARILSQPERKAHTQDQSVAIDFPTTSAALSRLANPAAAQIELLRHVWRITDPGVRRQWLREVLALGDGERDATTEPVMASRRQPGAQLAIVADLDRFLADCVEKNAGGRIRSADLYELFIAWARATRRPECTHQKFGLDMKRCGFKFRKSNVVFFLDIRAVKTVSDFGRRRLRKIAPASGER